MLLAANTALISVLLYRFADLEKSDSRGAAVNAEPR
jgi:hypothetical protein